MYVCIYMYIYTYTYTYIIYIYMCICMRVYGCCQGDRLNLQVCSFLSCLTLCSVTRSTSTAPVLRTAHLTLLVARSVSFLFGEEVWNLGTSLQQRGRQHLLFHAAEVHHEAPAPHQGRSDHSWHARKSLGPPGGAGEFQSCRAPNLGPEPTMEASFITDMVLKSV